MRIDDLDGRMRAFEAALDPCVLPGVWMVARLDGRNFTRLTKETHPFEAPSTAASTTPCSTHCQTAAC